MSEPCKTGVIIVSYNSAQFIDRCLEPFSRNAHPCDVVVVDNNSSDDTSTIVARTFPFVKYMQSEENIGFSRANNLAIRNTHNEYVLLLNPDAFLESTAQIAQLEEFLDSNPKCAAVGVQLLNLDETHQVGDAGWKTNLVNTLSYSFLLGTLFRMPSLYLSNKKYLLEKVVDVDWVCGACMLMRRSAIDQIGGLDERIFMYGEDVEWGERARSHGWGISYLPQVKVLHLQGATQRQPGEVFYSTKWIDSRVTQLNETRGALVTASFMLLMLMGVGLRAIVLMSEALLSGHRSNKAGVMWRYARHVAVRLIRYRT